MAFDLQVDLRTGDLVWNSIRDLAGVEAENLFQQRIHNRLKIVRGSFIYDRTGTLGSNLINLVRMGIPQSAANLELLIRDALTPMTDIILTDVVIHTYNDGSGEVTDPSAIKATIKYQIAISENELLSPNTPGPFEAQIAIAV